MFHVKHSNKICWPIGISGRMEKNYVRINNNQHNGTHKQETTESSTSNTNDDALAPIKNLIDTMNHDELLALKEYIEKRL